MKNKKIYTIAIILMFLSLIFIFSGVSYSIFSYLGSGMTDNVIKTGKIVFSYSDSNGGGNGINIENATPIPDVQGKLLTGQNEYFDFSVLASTTNTNLGYEISVIKSSESTLDDKYVKIYLTTFEGGQEVEVPLTIGNDGVITYDKLNDTNNPLLANGKTVYFGTVKAGEVAYNKNFRLRMWVSAIEDPNFDNTVLNDKFYSVKVNVAANGM